MHQHDQIDNPTNHDETTKELFQCLKERNISIEGNISDLRKCCTNAKPLITNKKEHGKIIKGHAGTQLGLTELLCRRGWVDPNASKLPTNAEAHNISKTTPVLID